MSKIQIWFKNLKVSEKLALISIFFVMPDSVMLYLFITGINANLQFASLEKKGSEYQRPLEVLLELIPEHERLAEAALVDSAGGNVAITEVAHLQMEEIDSMPSASWKRSMQVLWADLPVYGRRLGPSESANTSGHASCGRIGRSLKTRPSPPFSIRLTSWRNIATSPAESGNHDHPCR